MPRFIFPADTFATDGIPRFVRHYRTATATRPLEDLRNLDGDVDTTPIPNGRLVVDSAGELQAFAGPDDLTTLWREVEGDETREAITATGPVAYTAAPTGPPIILSQTEPVDAADGTVWISF